MPEENVNNVTVQETPAPKNKNKPEKTKVILVGAGSCSIESFYVKNGDVLDVDAATAERLLGTGLFQKT